MTAPAADTATSPRRPFGLYVLAGLLLVKAAVLLGIVLDVELSADHWIRQALQFSPELVSMVESSTLSVVVGAVLAVLLVGSAIGLVLLRRDGWVLAMVITGLFVAGDVYGFVNGVVSYVWMALNIITVFYLNQTEVRAAVGVTTESLVPGGAE